MGRSTDRYGLLVIATHWLMLALLIAIYAAAELGRTNWHISLGMLVLPLLALRLIGRATSPVPPIVPALPAMQLRLAGFIHFLLYLFLLAMPLLGWLAVNARGEHATLLGYALPDLAGPDARRGAALVLWHRLIGDVGYGLIAFHTIGTLFHHYFVKDNTVTRMLPLAAGERASG